MSHAYFRNQQGSPHTSSDGKYSPTHILSDMGKASFVDGNGGIAYKGIPFMEYDLALETAFVVLDENQEELGEHDTHSILWKALNALARKSPGVPFKPSDLLREANKAAGAFLRSSHEKFVVVTSLSIAQFPGTAISMDGSTISPIADRFQRYPLPGVLNNGHHRAAFEEHITATKYCHIKIIADGRSHFEALDKALDALTLLRALWSVYGTYGRRSWRMGSPTKNRMGFIHTGPIYTLHSLDGKSIDDNRYWFDPVLPADHDLFNDVKVMADLEKQRKWAIRKIKNLKYRRALVKLLTRYVTALDQTDHNVAFLQMWSILEHITNTIGKEYDKTISRSISIFSQDYRPVVKEYLEILRTQRNKIVHSGGLGQQSDQIAYLLKSILDPHMHRLISNPFSVGSLEEYAEFLSLPSDILSIKKRIKSLSLALRIAKKDIEPS